MNILKIKNKKDFIDNFLSPISNLNDMCIINVSPTNITSTLASTDQTIVCQADLECEVDLGSSTHVSLNIPDIKRLIRVLELIPSVEIELVINSNNIEYSKSGYKFKYHTLEDNIIKIPKLNVNKVHNLEFETSFKVTESALNTLYKGSSVTAENSKLYIYCDGDNVSGELGDRNRHNVDNFVCILSESCEGKSITSPLALNFEAFRLLSFKGSREVTFKVNQELGIAMCVIQKNDVVLTYVMTSYV